MDTARWLRFLVPGSVFELALGTWILFDHTYSSSYGSLLEASAFEFAALVIAATIPIGFVCSVVTQFIIWMTWTKPDPIIGRNCSQQQLKRLGLEGREYESDIGRIAARCARPEIERAEAIIDYVLHSGVEERIASRARSLLDLSNSLANSAVAVALALLSVVAFFGVSSVFQISDGFSLKRLLIFFFAMVIQLLLCAVILESQRRVSRIGNYFIDLSLGPPEEPGI
jgi:hypothetical protein